ncbi:cyclase family protein [Spirochaetota bacterium]
MAIHDITLTISKDLPIWPGDPAVEIIQKKSIRDGDGCNVSKIVIGAHSGTHVDAPYHFLENGYTIDNVRLEDLIGPCSVIELGVEQSIEKDDLADIDIVENGRILFKTKNSEFWEKGVKDFKKNYIFLGESGADYLADKNISVVGIDYLSIEGFFSDNNNSVHKRLLEKEIIIIEGLNLFGIIPGDYELICLPLNIQGAEGAPARVILRDIDLS